MLDTITIRVPVLESTMCLCSSPVAHLALLDIPNRANNKHEIRYCIVMETTTILMMAVATIIFYDRGQQIWYLLATLMYATVNLLWGWVVAARSSDNDESSGTQQLCYWQVITNPFCWPYLLADGSSGFDSGDIGGSRCMRCDIINEFLALVDSIVVAFMVVK